MEYNRKLEKWRPGYNALQDKARTDEILARLISTATCRQPLGVVSEPFLPEPAGVPCS